MGIAADARRLALGTRDQIWQFRNAPDIAPQLPPAGTHDACYLPRSSHVSGDIAVHELAWAGDELWAVNTRFSCLCTFDEDYSFVPRWRPPFVTRHRRRGSLPPEWVGPGGRPAAIRHRARGNGYPAGLAAEQTTRRVPDRCAERGVSQSRAVDAAFAPVARRPDLAAGVRHRTAGDDGPRPSRDGCRSSGVCPRSGSGRPVRVRRPLEDPRDVRHGRRATGRETPRAQVRCRRRGRPRRCCCCDARVPDRGGRDLRRAATSGCASRK